jgi:hypothetical protein
MPKLPPKTRLAIKRTLAALDAAVLTKSDLERAVLTPANRAAWGIPEQAGLQAFLNALVEEQLIALTKIRFPHRTFDRYLIGTPSAYEVVQSISADGYFSHFSAMRLHALTDQLPKVLYFNVEQHLAPGGGTLEQAAIDRTFRRPCRVSHNVATYEGANITFLNGGNTGRTGVERLRLGREATTVQVTTVERTLIDIAIRPIYSGGVFEVAKAYAEAATRASVPQIARMLSTIRYTYPYHQVIGYYLERAKYRASDVELMRQFPIEFDFYLDYGMRQTEYNARWKLFIPKGF